MVIDNIHLFFSNSVVTTSEVIGCIFFTIDKKFRVEKTFQFSSSNIIKNGWFKIDSQVSWHKLSIDSFFEKGFEVVVVACFLLFTIDTNVVFLTILFPDGITHLNTTLTDGDS